MEVYNERINDLLSSDKKSKDLPMRDIAGAINIRGLSEKEPETAEQLMEWLKEGNNLRTQVCEKRILPKMCQNQK